MLDCKAVVCTPPSAVLVFVAEQGVFHVDV